MAEAIVAEGLKMTYGPVKALDGLDLRVTEGTVMGLLGPNGAGKTTCVRILATLLRPTSGHATVAGIDVLAHPEQVRAKITSRRPVSTRAAASACGRSSVSGCDRARRCC
jgi:ABC-2 type transport system ATP-binding protein